MPNIKLHVLTLISLAAAASAVSLDVFSSCCTYCKGQQHSWTTSASPWNFSLSRGDFVTDFAFPAAYLVNHEVNKLVSLYGRDYPISYAGAPVYLTYTTFNDRSKILTDQYVQLDLGSIQSVAGVKVQGGYYDDPHGELFHRKEFFVISFMASYSTSGTTFQYITYDGSARVFSGNKFDDAAIFVDFDVVVEARYVRVHPFSGMDSFGEATHVLIRVSPIVCSTGNCFYEHLNCKDGNWGSWSGCECKWGNCNQVRYKPILRYQSCGGSPCGESVEQKSCSTTSSMLLPILVIIIVMITIIVVIIIIVIRKKCKKEKDEIFSKEEGKKEMKKRKDRKLRDDIGGEAQVTNLEDLEEDDNLEGVLSPQNVKNNKKAKKDEQKKKEKEKESIDKKDKKKQAEVKKNEKEEEKRRVAETKKAEAQKKKDEKETKAQLAQKEKEEKAKEDMEKLEKIKKEESVRQKEEVFAVQKATVRDTPGPQKTTEKKAKKDKKAKKLMDAGEQKPDWLLAGEGDVMETGKTNLKSDMPELNPKPKGKGRVKFDLPEEADEESAFSPSGMPPPAYSSSDPLGRGDPFSSDPLARGDPFSSDPLGRGDPFKSISTSNPPGGGRGSMGRSGDGGLGALPPLGGAPVEAKPQQADANSDDYDPFLDQLHKDSGSRTDKKLSDHGLVMDDDDFFANM